MLNSEEFGRCKSYLLEQIDNSDKYSYEALLLLDCIERLDKWMEWLSKHPLFKKWFIGK